MKNTFTFVLLALAAAAAQAQAVKGNVADGQKKVAMCIGCHGMPGYQATFPEVYKVPMISGQNEKFIAASLEAYKKGERKHPSMRGIAASMSEQDIADVSAFYAQHGGAPTPAPEQVPAPSAQVAALLTKGACASCHGVNYSKPIDGAYPKIAGQYADYLYAALKSYKVEGNPRVGRANAIMAGQVKQFSNDELKAMANYLASLPTELKTVRQSPFHSTAH
jgi:cytochrome c553